MKINLSVLFIPVFFLPFSPVFSSDVGNCLMCHKYPGLSRITEEGELKLFFVNEEIFKNSVHAKVSCEGCHTDINEIPHGKVQKVDCMVLCHIEEPTSATRFSHSHAAKFLENSVHSKTDENGDLKEYHEDYPECKDCHDNPLYRPISFFKKVRPGISQAALGRCRVCHESDEFIYRFYNHITTRLHKIRNPKNIAETCKKCHDDPALISRHDLSRPAVISYEASFHGKAANFLDENIPDCLDCHVNAGESVHQMHSFRDPLSATHENNKSQSCSTLDCHEKATPKLGNYQVHSEFGMDQSPGQFYFSMFFYVLTGGTLLPLMLFIFLDLFRRLFPDFVLVRRRSRNEK